MKQFNRIISLPLIAIFIFCSVFSFGSVMPVAADENKALVAYYKFDGDLKDYSGMGNDGKAIGNAITYSNAIVGKGAKFDGASYIEVEDSDSLDLDKAFTVSAWLYKDTAGPKAYAPVLSKGDNNFGDENTPFAIYHSYDGYSPSVRLINSDYYETYTCNTKMSLQKWHNLSVVFNGKDVTFYLDGVLKDKHSWDGGELFSSDQKLLIGCDPVDGSKFFKGIMDDLRIYNYALTDADVKTVYEATKSAGTAATTTTTTTTTTAPANTTTTTTSTNTTTTVSSNGLVAYYPFNTDLKDLSGNGNDGTAIGNVTYAPGMVGNGAKFNGSTYIEVEDSDSLDLNSAFTVSAWLYKDGPGPKNYSPILSKGDSNYGDENTPFALYHDYDGYSPTVRLINTDYYETLGSNTKYSGQRWHLLTVTFDSQDVRFYINGVLKSKHSWDGGDLFSSDQKLLIGCDPVDGSKFFKGIMDDLRIYNRVLADNEIKALYETVMKTKDTTGKLVGYYKFDGDIKDYSGYNNHGTAIGNITYVNGIIGKGAKFNGSSYIEVKDSDSLDVNKAFTISTWVNKENAGIKGSAPILSKGEKNFDDENTPLALYHSYDGYTPEVRLINTEEYDTLSSDTRVSMQKWYMLSVTFDGKNVKFYVDGVLKATRTWNGGELFHSAQDLLIGCDPINSSKFFKGTMDDLRIYNYTLADKDIKALYDWSKKPAVQTVSPYSGQKITIAPTKVPTLKVKQTFKLTVTATPTKGAATNITDKVAYKSNNTKVVTINKGVITAVGKGTTTVVVTVGNQTFTLSVTVK